MRYVFATLLLVWALLMFALLSSIVPQTVDRFLQVMP